jgi:hypothetical protein
MFTYSVHMCYVVDCLQRVKTQAPDCDWELLRFSQASFHPFLTRFWRNEVRVINFPGGAGNQDPEPREVEWLLKATQGPRCVQKSQVTLYR